MGHPGLVAGLTVNLAGFGDFSGAYLIEKATHKVGGSGGYTTALELRKCRLAPDVRMSSGSRAVAQNVPVKKPQPDPDPAPVLPVNPTDKWATLFDLFRQFWLAKRVSKLHELLICLPAIAENMAGKADNADDAQGWLYLQSMFHHWFSGKSSKYGKEGEPFWVEWEWVMQYDRAALAYAQFVDLVPSVEQQIMNYQARQQLGKIVTRQPECKALGEGEHWDFDFISTSWTEWEDKYHTLKAVPRVSAYDGLMAALAGFTLRALAKGSVQYKGKGEYTITVCEIAVFVRDKFQFEEDVDAAANKLGYWNCEQLSFSRVPFQGYGLLFNEMFRDFRNRSGNGGDFLVLSQPHLVENFSGARYDYA